MEESRETNHRDTGFAELIGKLEEARSRIPHSEAKLKSKGKPPESYLILKDGTVAETDHTEHKKGAVTISETKL